ncbi:MAG: hypothetical protein HYY18_05645 [Planctomycetes bacterium]|nr:hypothetical protein [Planctomycetota bacterium]
MLRAGPFSDERVRGLANRRFVNFYFDLSDEGAAGDPDARKFVTAIKKELGRASVGTPSILIVSAAGDIVGETDNFASSGVVYAAMKKALKERPEFDAGSGDEKAAVKPIEKARIAFELGKGKTAADLLAKPESEDEWLFLAHIQRWREEWDAMEEALSHIRREDLLDDARMERAWRSWRESKYEALRDGLADFPADSNRSAEARYFEALARYHLGEKKEALKAWKELAKSPDEGPWVYRADWAWMTVKQAGKTSFSTGDANRSPLGRVGYLGRDNPDLKGPGR